jgi:LysR family transcriptional regulator, chromosome initiation inhibitor
VRAPRLRERFVPSSEAYLRAALMGWGIGVVPEIQAREALSAGALVALRPDVGLSVRLFWHQWKLAEGDAPPRVATLDRIGAALAAGARALSVPPRPRSGG